MNEMISNYLESLNELLWSSSFWLPDVNSWNELKKHKNYQTNDLFNYSLLLAVLIYIMRLCFEK